MAKAGVIGAGLMGTALAQRLLQAHFEVVAYDVDDVRLDAVARLGVRAAASIAEVAGHCDSIVIAVFDTGQVERVMEGAGGVLEVAAKTKTSPIVICTSTCDPARLAALAARVEARALRFLEVPMSGTSRQVAAGE